jgi:AcrR family transcriptional regulator
MADEPPRSTVRLSSAEQRERLLKTAAELFARKGYHATGVAELGRAVSLGRGGLYHHIGSKEELLVEISVRHVRQMVAVGEEVLATDATPPQKLRQLSRWLMRTISENLPEVTVFFREVNSLTRDERTEVLSARKRFERIWLELFQEGVEQGVFREADPIVIKGLLGMHNYSYVWIDPEGGRLAPEEIADVFCDTILRGLLTDKGLAELDAAEG